MAEDKTVQLPLNNPDYLPTKEREALDQSNNPPHRDLNPGSDDHLLNLVQPERHEDYVARVNRENEERESRRKAKEDNA